MKFQNPCVVLREERGWSRSLPRGHTNRNAKKSGQHPRVALIQRDVASAALVIRHIYWGLKMKGTFFYQIPACKLNGYIGWVSFPVNVRCTKPNSCKSGSQNSSTILTGRDTHQTQSISLKGWYVIHLEQTVRWRGVGRCLGYKWQ